MSPPAANGPRILIAGMGNVLCADDGFGFGVAVAEALSARTLPPQVKVVEVGIGGMHLVQELMAGWDALIIVDAVERGAPPGTLFVLEPDSTEAVVMAGQPVLDAQGAFQGAVAVGIDLRWLEFLARRVELPARATVTALGSDGQVLVRFVAGSETATSDPASDPAPSEALRQEMATLGTGTVRGLNQAREPRVYGFHRADSGGLVVAVGLPPYLAFARYGAALRDTLTAPLMILVLALAAAWWGAERLITRWVRSLTRAAREMAHGDLSVRSKVPHTRYEIGRLAAAFDTMASTIERSQSGLRQAVAERETLLRELNHRVKNNLQIVISLLNLHARKFTDPGVRGQFRDITGRIQTLSVVHELLYQGAQTQTAFPDYVGRLCQALHDLYQVQPDSAEIETRLEPVSLPLD